MLDKTFTGDEKQKKEESKGLNIVVVASGPNPRPMPKKVKSKRTKLPSMAVLQSNIKKYIIGQSIFGNVVIIPFSSNFINYYPFF